MRTINYYFRLLTTQAKRLHAEKMSVRITNGKCVVKFTSHNNVISKSKYHFDQNEMTRCVDYLLTEHASELADGSKQFAHDFGNGQTGMCVVTQSDTARALYVTLVELEKSKPKPKKFIGAYIPKDAKASFHTKIREHS